MDHQSSEPDINILLLGPTGVGKTTFVNAFGNYLLYNSLASAMKREMLTLIPASFIITEPNTFKQVTITVGAPNKNERHEDTGQSNTQYCQSYKFRFADRNLRVIDAPGIGDTRGLQQDAKNLEYILDYISQYKYLNAICILLKPNEERLTVPFRFCIKELLTHLHVSARENIMFIFTNCRGTFYAPGSTAPHLRVLLKELFEKTGVNVPFSNENTFCLDNEPFRYLALHKNGIRLSSKEQRSYDDSWEISAKEVVRLFSHIMNCEPHNVQDTLSINTAQQLIRKLGRPMSEVLRLIEENKALAKRYEEQIRKGSLDELKMLKAVPQKSVRIKPLKNPCTVCTSDTCTRVIMVGDHATVEYHTECHPKCFLRSVEQEVINSTAFLNCRAFDKTTGYCKICGCSYQKHMHITYRYEESITYIDMNTNYSPRQANNVSSLSSVTYDTWLASIQKRIKDLEEEETCMMEIATKLSLYLHENAITPYNDDFIAYLELFTQEEQMKRQAGEKNQTVVDGLKRLSAQYKREMDLLKMNKPSSTLEEKVTMKMTQSAPQKLKDVFELIEFLYALPINGPLLRKQVEGLKNGQSDKTKDHEISIDVSRYNNESSLVSQLEDTFSAVTSF